jgi:NAD(P)-dependent dehydrogenase (short-subunit alcohol dehydrogenase family)
MAQDTGGAAVIVGTGSGLSASLARLCAGAGMKVVLAARHPEKLAELVKATKATAEACDATKPAEVAAFFDAVARQHGAPELVVFNAGYRTRGPLLELDPAEVEKTLISSAFGGFLVAQAAARLMLSKDANGKGANGKGRGSIFFTGASASVKGYAQSAPFAMGKFALRGLAQSLARELQPKGIHVAHFVIDGGIASSRGPLSSEDKAADKWLDPDAIAATYLAVHRQPRSAWSTEMEVRPWVENF